MYYIGLDVHKKTISYGVKDASGRICQEGASIRPLLQLRVQALHQPQRIYVHDHIRARYLFFFRLLQHRPQ